MSIADAQERRGLSVLLVRMVLGAALEVIGIGAVTTFIAILADPGIVARHDALSWAQAFLMDSSGTGGIALTSAALVGIFIVKNAYLASLVHAQTRFAYNMEARLSRQLLAKYLSMPYPFFLQRNSAELMRNITNEVSHVVTGIVIPLLTMVSEIIVLLFIFVMVASVEPLVGIAVLGVLGATGLVFTQAVKPLMTRSGTDRSNFSVSRIKWVNQAIGSIKEVKLLGREDFFVNAFQESTRRFTRAGLVANTLYNLPKLITETVAVASILIVVVIVHAQERSFSSVLPTLTLLALAAMRVMPSVNRITPGISQLRFWLPAFEVVHADLQIARTAPASDRGTAEARDADHRKVLSTRVEAKNISFRYDGASGWALRGVSLLIPQGASVAFMGPSGAGKSTLVDLLLGLVDPHEGEIWVDDVPLAEVRTAWQRKVGYVPQFIYILDDSIRRNVALGVRDDLIDDKRVWAVLAQARLAALVQEAPGRLDAAVGERGIKLSGGERQRLGIARALYHDPEVLVFDEATSALDSQTEREIADTIGTLTGAKTILIVAHRVTTVQRSDIVFFLRRGELVDTGSFAQLMERNREFREMVGHLSKETPAAQA